MGQGQQRLGTQQGVPRTAGPPNHTLITIKQRLRLHANLGSIPQSVHGHAADNDRV